MSLQSSACGGNITKETGEIVSPNYPQSYPSNTICIWTFSLDPGQRLEILLEDAEIESDSDFLRIFDSDILVKELTGPLQSSPFSMAATGSSIRIEFTSDDTIQWRGFLASLAIN